MSETQEPHLRDDTLLDLAHGLLGEEREGALAHIRTCPACESRLLRWSGDVERARAGAQRAVRQSQGRSPHRYRWLWAAGAAAASVLVAAALFLPKVNRENHEERRPDPPPYWLALDTQPILRRIEGPQHDAAAMAAALDAHRRRDARGVLRALEGVDVPAWMSPIRLVQANALVAEGLDDQAVSLLDASELEALPQPIRDRARWLLYGALVRSGRDERARTVLETLAARPGEFSDAARTALAQGPMSTKPPQ